MAFRFDCFSYYVTDLDRSIVFYRDILGMKFLSRDAVARSGRGVLKEERGVSEREGEKEQGTERLPEGSKCRSIARNMQIILSIPVLSPKKKGPSNESRGPSTNRN